MAEGSEIETLIFWKIIQNKTKGQFWTPTNNFQRKLQNMQQSIKNIPFIVNEFEVVTWDFIFRKIR